MQLKSHAAVYVVEEQPFLDEVAAGLRRARELSRLPLEHYAATLSATLQRPVSPALVEDWESCRQIPDARVWFAACRVADQPQSAVTGEMELVPSIYELERTLSDLLSKVSETH